jgi:hypothetical protein
MNGSSNCRAILMTDSQEKPPPLAERKRLANSGVRKMPNRLEADALHTAAGTFPRASEVKAIDDCTVEGIRHRSRTPAPPETARSHPACAAHRL